MIEARKSRLFRLLFNFYFRRLLARSFHDFGFAGDVEPADDQPLLYIMNHSSWWDGLLAYHVTNLRSRRDHYMMMDERQLIRYRFFSKLGAFSIDKSSPFRTMPALRYAGRLLQKNRAVWMFPQGEIEHADSRPIRFQSGVGYVLQACPQTLVVPVTLHYAFGIYRKAGVTMQFGEPIRSDWSTESRKDIAERLGRALERQLEEHKNIAVKHPRVPLPGFASLLGKDTRRGGRTESALRMEG